MMRLFVAACAAILMFASFGSAVSAASTDSGVAFTPLAGLDKPAVPSGEANTVRVADGFGAGLAIGFIGGLITGHVKHRHYGHRGHYRRHHYRGCRHWHRRCGRNWGYHNNSYYGCMRYHGCR